MRDPRASKRDADRHCPRAPEESRERGNPADDFADGGERCEEHVPLLRDEGYEIRIIGNSLGAGVGALLAMLLNRVPCFAGHGAALPVSSHSISRLPAV